MRTQGIPQAVGGAMLAAGLGFWATLAPASESDTTFIPQLINSSTIPSTGDVNPYGVAFVPNNFPGGGKIAENDVLVSNFNNGANLQGAGTTIIQLTPKGPIAPIGMAVTFFTSSLPGLSTALGVLRGGFVVVGNVPTTDGTFGTIGQGAIQVIDRNGHLVHTWVDATFLNGPWDLAVDDRGDQASIFVSTVLNGSVTRLDVTVGAKGVTVLHKTVIATGYSHVPDAAALVLGPTGLAYDPQTDTLFVASTHDNAVFAISQARSRAQPVTRGRIAFADAHLRGPLALRFAPNGHLLAANGDAVNPDPLHPSEIVEFTTGGEFVREYNVDASPGGAFGIDTLRDGPFNYAVIDDVTNSLSISKLSDQ